MFLPFVVLVVVVLDYILHYTTTIMSDPTSILRAMLHDSEHSDVSFLCKDGVEIPAHRSVLAVASPYFRTAFRGPWQESSSGIWETQHSSNVIKVILTFVYTGTVDWQASNPVEVWAAVNEYDIQGLKDPCEKRCITQLDLNNITQMLRIARLYGATSARSGQQSRRGRR